MRHKDKCIDEKGIVAECKMCNLSFSVSNLIECSLNKWIVNFPNYFPENTKFPLTKEISDVYAMRYPYQVNERDKKMSQWMKKSMIL